MNVVPLVTRAMYAFDRAAERPCCVRPAVPILFFGDLDAWLKSPLRVLTVGLNPSLHEFPGDDPFHRFPLAAGAGGRESPRYLEAMSAYFRTRPYRGWFSSFEHLLGGMDASFYEGRPSTALHTDICSPVATNPTWSGLGKADRQALARDGLPLWRLLLEQLRPQIVALSVARKHLDDIGFDAMGGWKVIHRVRHKVDGGLRRHPYNVEARWYDVGGAPSLFVFGPAAQTPFGTLAASQKQQAGSAILEAWRDGR